MIRRAWGGSLVLILALSLAGAWGRDIRAANPLTGEVAWVDPEAATLVLELPDGGTETVRLAPGAEVRLNGATAALWALRPVAPGFRPEAQVWLDADGRALRLEGSYLGGEAQVVAVGEDGGLELELLTECGPEGRTRRAMSPECRVQRGGEWLPPSVLRPGDLIYVLFDLSGRAKKIALSE